MAPRKLRRFFVSYRRNDSGGYARLLVESIRDRRGQRCVFLDVRDIIPGDQFQNEIAEEIGRCAVVLIVIGPDWLTIKGRDGNPRIRNADDVVRREVQLSLQQIPTGTLVIPVTVGGAKVPAEKDLPEDIAQLAKLSAIDLAQESWTRDVAELFSAVRDAWKKARPLRGWFEFGSALKAALAMSAAVMLPAVLGRWVAPLYLFTEWILAGILIALGGTTLFVVWNGWHPGPRLVRNAGWRTWSVALIGLPILFGAYLFENPLRLSVGTDWKSLARCNEEYYVQPFIGSSPRWQPTSYDPNATPCQNNFSATYQEITLRAGFAPWSGTLNISTAESGFIEAILVPAANQDDVIVKSPDGKTIQRPAARPSAGLRVRDAAVSFVCWFRVESPQETVPTIATLWSPFKWKAAEGVLHATTQLRPVPALSSAP